MTALIAIVAVEGRNALERLPEGASLEDRLRASMAACRNHWMVTDEDQQMLAACEGVYTTATEEERDRIKAELEALSILSAMMSGVPVDLDRANLPENPVGILRLWREGS